MVSVISSNFLLRTSFSCIGCFGHLIMQSLSFFNLNSQIHITIQTSGCLVAKGMEYDIKMTLL